MTNAELIKALRWCGSDDEQHEMCVDESYSCPMWNEDRMTDYCKADLMLAAADLIEAQQKALDECSKQLADMAKKLKEERNKTVTEIFLEEQLWWEDRCKELEAERMELIAKCRRLEAQTRKGEQE